MTMRSVDAKKPTSPLVKSKIRGKGMRGREWCVKSTNEERRRACKRKGREGRGWFVTGTTEEEEEINKSSLLSLLRPSTRTDPTPLHPSLPPSLPPPFLPSLLSSLLPSPSSSPDMRIEIKTLTATFPKSNEHNRRFPSRRTGAIRRAQRRDSESPASMTISRPILSSPMKPSVRPAKRPRWMGTKEGGEEEGGRIG